MDEICYDSVERLDPSELRDFYLAQGHPVPDSLDKLEQMIRNSVSFVTARTRDGRIIGIARGIADGLRGYLTECKLDRAYQGPGAVTGIDGRIEHDAHGIARTMAQVVLRSLAELGVERIDLCAYGTEVDFCTELGFRKSTGQVAMWLDTKTLALQAAS